MQIVLVILLSFISLSASATYPITWKKNPFEGSTYILPNDSQKHTSVIMLHGSEGGSAPFVSGEANLLAVQGYSVLAYCYFDCNRFLVGPRATLKDVETTKILDVVEWLRAQPESNGKVVIYGFSRGAELAMIVGSLATTSLNKPNGLIAHSPSDLFNGAWNWSWREPSCWLCIATNGECNESSPESDFKWNPSCGPDDPEKIDWTKSSWKISGETIASEKRIEIEKFGNPILLTVGELDRVWPADQTRRIEATLKANGQPYEVHYFPNGDHGFRGNDEILRREIVLDFLGRVP